MFLRYVHLKLVSILTNLTAFLTQNLFVVVVIFEMTRHVFGSSATNITDSDLRFDFFAFGFSFVGTFVSFLSMNFDSMRPKVFNGKKQVLASYTFVFLFPVMYFINVVLVFLMSGHDFITLRTFVVMDISSIPTFGMGYEFPSIMSYETTLYTSQSTFNETFIVR